MSRYRIQPEGILEIKTQRVIFRGENTYIIECHITGKLKTKTFQVIKYGNYDYKDKEDFNTKKEMMEWIDQDGGKKKNV